VIFITKAKSKDMSFIVQAKVKDMCFPDVKTKAKDIVSSRTFSGLLPTHCFIVTLFYVGFKNTSSMLLYDVNSSLQNKQ